MWENGLNGEEAIKNRVEGEIKVRATEGGDYYCWMTEETRSLFDHQRSGGNIGAERKCCSRWAPPPGRRSAPAVKAYYYKTHCPGSLCDCRVKTRGLFKSRHLISHVKKCM